MIYSKKVFKKNILIIFILTLFCKTEENNGYKNLEMYDEDPLVFESWEFVRNFFKNSSYINNDKEICNFFSGNWKYENNNIYIEYLFATKNYKNKEINIYKILINHNEIESKSYKHNIEGSWKILLFEKMKSQIKLEMNDKIFNKIYKIIKKYILKDDKYKLIKINEIFVFEKINKIKDRNEYLCNATLIKKDDNINIEDNNNFIEEFLIEEEIETGDISMIYVIHLNPNI